MQQTKQKTIRNRQNQTSNFKAPPQKTQTHRQKTPMETMLQTPRKMRVATIIMGQHMVHDRHTHMPTTKTKKRIKMVKIKNE